MNSRKWIMGAIGFIATVLSVIFEQAGVTSVDWEAISATLLQVVVYAWNQAPRDVQRIKQFGKFKDPKFWISLVNAIVAWLSQFLGINLPVGVISMAVSLIVGALFKVKFDPQDPT